MADDRQWFLIKLVGAIMGLFLLVSSCIGAANMFFDLKRDVGGITVDVSKAEDNIDKIKDEIHGLQLSDAVAEAHYQSILAELSESKKHISELKIQNIKILEILSGFRVVD
jgi:hypothetical protein